MAETDEALGQAIRDAYAVFPEVRWRGRSATVCACCVSAQAARALATTRREDLSCELIEAYLGSAHHVSEGSAADEVRHFLPRIFELLAANARFRICGKELALIRLGRGPLGWDGQNFRDCWSKAEVDAVDRFLRAYWTDTLARPPDLFRRAGTGEWLFSDDDVEAVLCMIARTDTDLAPFLSLWDADPALAASLHMAALVSRTMIREWHPFALLEDRRLGNAHWERHEAAMRQVVDWLVDPRRRDRLFAAVMAEAPGSPQAIVLAEAHDEIDRLLSA
ncbi:hypothetical protein CCR97_25665 [Rhodoplanes elegans]|uniref:Uncharacterized protein n=1 Tax=Rhodoplanes elegans TaxID=29408 RepID=A0A327KE13_9BRAD|nr:hypothetical protein [Rhodoplanes elegans]MBK5961568.1 hypothetical protein [Rhodoplanes elegans]RAI36371.1 hypothetical protein CH338_17710 [Rhodoplanes elegans]